MSSATVAEFVFGPRLDQGGEADIYRVQGHPDLLIKVFRQEIPAQARRRIDQIIASRTQALDAVAAWPLRWIRMDSKDALLLPFASNTQPIHVLFDRVTWVDKFPDATWAFMVEVARNAAIAVAAVHAAGLAVVDISEKNMLVGQDASVTMIDCDSFVFLDQDALSMSPCYSAGWLPPELMSCVASEPRTANHDNFSLARLIFQLLFAGRAPLEAVPGSDLDDTRRIFGYSELNRVRPPSPADVALSDLPALMAGYFERAFSGTRPQNTLRPTASEWVDALTQMQNTLRTCSQGARHRYVSAGGRTCPWCRIAGAPHGRDPFRQTGPQAGPADTVAPPPAPSSPPQTPQASPPPPRTSPPPSSPGTPLNPPGWTGPYSSVARKLRVSFDWFLTCLGWIWAALALLVGLVRIGIGVAFVVGIGWLVLHFGGAIFHAVQTRTAAAPPSAERRAADFVVNLTANFGRSDASRILDQAYGDTVIYFKVRRPHSYVMNEKNNLIERWPQRNYVPQADSVATRCNAEKTYCVVSLETNFQVRNGAKSNSGRWSSEIGLDMRKDPPVVTQEEGHAVH